MVSKFGHLRYLYPPSRLKLSPLVTVKLLSSPKIKEPVLVRLRMNDRAMLRSSVHFCTHFLRPIYLYRMFDASKFLVLRLALPCLRIDLTVCETFSAQSILRVPFRQSLPRIHRVLCALLPFSFASASHTCVNRDYQIASVTHAGCSVCTDFCS